MTDAPQNANFVIEGSMALYRDLRVLHPAVHGDSAIRLDQDSFGFAAKTALIPITVDEFQRAALDYPLVFVGADRRAFAVMGLEPDRNLFVEKDGRFATGCYIPAYLRRYPFVFARDNAADLRILCLDQASERLVAVADDDGAAPLFDNGEPTELTQQAVDFCQQFDSAEKRTEAFAALLDELGVLVMRNAHYDVAGAGKVLLIEFATIDSAALEALSAEQFGRLRETGATGAVYALISSSANWEVLALDAHKQEVTSGADVDPEPPEVDP